MNFLKTFSEVFPTRVLLVFAAVAWLAAILSVEFDAPGHIMIRWLLSFFAVALLLKTLHGRAGILMLFPAAALALISLVFFSLLPALSLQWPDQLLRGPHTYATTTIYIGSTGELLVLQTSAMLFTLWAGLLSYFERRPVGGDPPHLHKKLGLWTTMVAIALILGSGSYLLFIVIWPPVAEFSQSRIGLQIRHAAQPLISVAVAALVYRAATDRRIHGIIALVAAVVAVAALLTTAAAKSAVFISISCLLLYAVTARFSLRKFAGVFGLMAALLIAGVLTLQFIRTADIIKSSSSIQHNLGQITSSIMSKLIWRQNVTGMCMQNAVESHFDKPARNNPFYFAFAVVPRVLWPEKPSLSRGTEFADKYCGFKRGAGVSNDHSVTLIGEPIIEAGVAGLVAAQAFLAILLVVVTVILLRNRPAGHIAMAALLPWLADFDQNFSMYFANATKMFLIMLPFIGLLMLFDRKFRRAALAVSDGRSISPGNMG